MNTNTGLSASVSKDSMFAKNLKKTVVHSPNKNFQEVPIKTDPITQLKEKLQSTLENTSALNASKSKSRHRAMTGHTNNLVLSLNPLASVVSSLTSKTIVSSLKTGQINSIGEWRFAKAGKNFSDDSLGKLQSGLNKSLDSMNIDQEEAPSSVVYDLYIFPEKNISYISANLLKDFAVLHLTGIILTLTLDVNLLGFQETMRIISLITSQSSTNPLPLGNTSLNSFTTSTGPEMKRKQSSAVREDFIDQWLGKKCLEVAIINLVEKVMRGSFGKCSSSGGSRPVTQALKENSQVTQTPRTGALITIMEDPIDEANPNSSFISNQFNKPILPETGGMSFKVKDRSGSGSPRGTKLISLQESLMQTPRHMFDRLCQLIVSIHRALNLPSRILTTTSKNQNEFFTKIFDSISENLTPSLVFQLLVIIVDNSTSVSLKFGIPSVKDRIKTAKVNKLEKIVATDSSDMPLNFATAASDEASVSKSSAKRVKKSPVSTVPTNYSVDKHKDHSVQPFTHHLPKHVCINSGTNPEDPTDPGSKPSAQKAKNTKGGVKNFIANISKREKEKEKEKELHSPLVASTIQPTNTSSNTHNSKITPNQSLINNSSSTSKHYIALQGAGTSPDLVSNSTRAHHAPVYVFTDKRSSLHGQNNEGSSIPNKKLKEKAAGDGNEHRKRSKQREIARESKDVAKDNKINELRSRLKLNKKGMSNFCNTMIQNMKTPKSVNPTVVPEANSKTIKPDSLGYKILGKEIVDLYHQSKLASSSLEINQGQLQNHLQETQLANNQGSFVKQSVTNDSANNKIPAEKAKANRPYDFFIEKYLKKKDPLFSSMLGQKNAGQSIDNCADKDHLESVRLLLKSANNLPYVPIDGLEMGDNQDPGALSADRVLSQDHSVEKRAGERYKHCPTSILQAVAEDNEIKDPFETDDMARFRRLRETTVCVESREASLSPEAQDRSNNRQRINDFSIPPQIQECHPADEVLIEEVYPCLGDEHKQKESEDIVNLQPSQITDPTQIQNIRILTPKVALGSWGLRQMMILNLGAFSSLFQQHTNRITRSIKEAWNIEEPYYTNPNAALHDLSQNQNTVLYSPQFEQSNNPILQMDEFRPRAGSNQPQSRGVSASFGQRAEISTSRSQKNFYKPLHHRRSKSRKGEDGSCDKRLNSRQSYQWQPADPFNKNNDMPMPTLRLESSAPYLPNIPNHDTFTPIFASTQIQNMRSAVPITTFLAHQPDHNQSHLFAQNHPQVAQAAHASQAPQADRYPLHPHHYPQYNQGQQQMVGMNQHQQRYPGWGNGGMLRY